MKWLGRLWGATRFAWRAWGFEWRHGPGAALVEHGATVPPTTTEMVAEITDVIAELAVEAVPAPTASKAPHPPLPRDAVAHYYVQTYQDGEAVIQYSGATGRDYRKCIEGLREGGWTFHAWMGGKSHDWGPR